MDKLTSIHSRAKFACICVEIDLDRPLATDIVVRGFPLYLEYEGLHAICFRCGSFSHKKDVCREIVEGEPVVKETEVVQVAGKEMATDHESVPGDGRADVSMTITTQADLVQQNKTDIQDGEDPRNYGSWMIAKTNRRRKYKGKGLQKVSNQVEAKKKEKISVKRKKEGSRFNALVDEDPKQMQDDEVLKKNDLAPLKSDTIESSESKNNDFVPET